VLPAIIRRPRTPHPVQVGRSGRLTAVLGLALAVQLTAGCGSGGAASSAPSPSSPAPTSAATTSHSATTGQPVPDPSQAGQAQPSLGSKVGAKSSAGGRITVGDLSLVARVNGSAIKVYPSAGATTPRWTLGNPLPSGSPLLFLVLDRSGDWLHVLVPVRPNESQGWVHAADVTLFQHDYRIVVSVGRHTLTLYQAGHAVMQVPVGLGTGSTPTPGGVFYTKELLKPPNPAGAYGPYAYGLSGYSDVLENFGGGDGEIGIHGTNDPAGVGHDVSHGCIRLTNENITKLAGMLPLGVPVQIVA